MGRPHADSGTGHIKQAQAITEETKSINNEEMAGAADPTKNRKRPHRQRRSGQANDDGLFINAKWVLDCCQLKTVKDRIVPPTRFCL
jgi:hypothetical protein